MCCKHFVKNLILFSLTFLISVSFSNLSNSNKRAVLPASPQSENNLSVPQLPKTNIQSGSPAPTVCYDMEAALRRKATEIQFWLKNNRNKSPKETEIKQKQFVKLIEAISMLEKRNDTNPELAVSPKNGISDLLYVRNCY